MFKIIKVNLKNNHNIKLNVDVTKEFKVKVDQQRKIGVKLEGANQVKNLHAFKVSVKQIHKISVSIDTSSNHAVIKTKKEVLNNKFKVFIRSQISHSDNMSAFKVCIHTHKVKCEIPYTSNKWLHSFKVIIDNKKTITVQLSDIILEKNRLTISNIGSIKGGLKTSFNTGGLIKNISHYNSDLSISPLKFYEIGITSNDRYSLVFKDKLVKAINSVIQDLSRYYTKLNLSENRLDIAILNNTSYNCFLNAMVNVKIKDWQDVIYAFNTWRELLDTVERWRDLLQYIPIEVWDDLSRGYESWGSILKYYDRWFDLIPNIENRVIINDRCTYISSINNTMPSFSIGVISSYLMTNRIKEGMGYGIDGYEYYTCREMLNVIIKILKIETWGDLRAIYNTWGDVYHMYEKWKDITDTELLNSIFISNNYRYYTDLIRSLIGLMTQMKLNSPMNDTVNENIAARARLNNISNLSSSTNLSVEYNHIMSWEDLLNRSDTWGSVNGKYQTWEDVYNIK